VAECAVCGDLTSVVGAASNPLVLARPLPGDHVDARLDARAGQPEYVATRAARRGHVIYSASSKATSGIRRVVFVW